MHSRVGETEADRNRGRCMVVHRRVRLARNGGRIRVVSQRLESLSLVFTKDKGFFILEECAACLFYQNDGGLPERTDFKSE